MALIQYYQTTCEPVNQAICIFIIMPIVICNLVSIKCIIALTNLIYNAYTSVGGGWREANDITNTNIALD